MYSWEIDRLLKIKQNIISTSEYFEIISTSPQIEHIKYNAYNDTTEIKTDDKYHFKFKVKSKGTRN